MRGAAVSLFPMCPEWSLPKFAGQEHIKKKGYYPLFFSFPDGNNVIPEFSPCPISSENAKDPQESCPGAPVWDEKAEEKGI